MQYHDDFTRAKKVVRAKMAFYIHLTAYVVVSALLVAVNLATAPGHLWFKWPLLGWGVGVIAHALVTFALARGPGIARRMIEKEMRNRASQKP
jgi:hypothetical protein